MRWPEIGISCERWGSHRPVRKWIGILPHTFGYVCVCSCVLACMCPWVWRPEVNLERCFLGADYLSFWGRVFQWPGYHWLGLVALWMSPRNLPVLLTQYRDYKYTPTTMPSCLHGYWGSTQVPILRPYTCLFFRGHTFLSGLTEKVFSDLFLVIRKIFNCKKEKTVWGFCMIILSCFSTFLPYQCQLGKLRHRAANREAKVWVLEVWLQPLRTWPQSQGNF